MVARLLIRVVSCHEIRAATSVVLASEVNPNVARARDLLTEVVDASRKVRATDRDIKRADLAWGLRKLMHERVLVIA